MLRELHQICHSFNEEELEKLATAHYRDAIELLNEFAQPSAINNSNYSYSRFVVNSEAPMDICEPSPLQSYQSPEQFGDDSGSVSRAPLEQAPSQTSNAHS